MIRGIKVEVEKTVMSDVFFTVDDADPRYASWFDENGKLVASAAALRNLAIEQAKGFDDWDWDDLNADFDVSGLIEVVDKQEALAFEHQNLSSLPDDQVPELEGITNARRAELVALRAEIRVSHKPTE